MSDQEVGIMNRYKNFVESVTSDASNSMNVFLDRVTEIDQVEDPSINVPLLLTACLGLAAEAGEFAEIPKKIFFQGKPLNADNVFHLKRELGDVIFYWVNACRALNLDPDEVIAENVRKLTNRYPSGKFDVLNSEHRQQGDI